MNREDFTIFTDHWLETDCLLPLTLDFNGDCTVNGVTQVANVDFVTTGSWTSWGLSQAVSVTLVQGVNTIKRVAQTANGLANIDYIELTGYLMD